MHGKRADRDGEGIDDTGEEVVLAVQAKQDQRRLLSGEES